MKNLLFVLSLVLGLVSLSSETVYAQKGAAETLGEIVGAGAGAGICSPAGNAAIGACGAIGAGVGGALGRSIDRKDQGIDRYHGSGCHDRPDRLTRPLITPNTFRSMPKDRGMNGNGHSRHHEAPSRPRPTVREPNCSRC